MSLLLGIAAVSFMQGRFDRSDRQKALQAVAMHEPAVQDCIAEMISRLEGKVRVRCEGREWAVDVVRGVLAEEIR